MFKISYFIKYITKVNTFAFIFILFFTTSKILFNIECLASMSDNDNNIELLHHKDGDNNIANNTNINIDNKKDYNNDSNNSISYDKQNNINDNSNNITNDSSNNKNNSKNNSNNKNKDIPLQDPTLESYAQEIFSDIKCLKCYGESIKNLNSDFAIESKQIIRELVQYGKSKKEIIDYMVSKYGEEVLMYTKLSSNTIWLWIVPLCLLGIGSTFVIYYLLFTKKNNNKNDIDDTQDNKDNANDETR